MRKFGDRISRMRDPQATTVAPKMSLAMAILITAALSSSGGASADDTMLEARLQSLGLPQLERLTFESDFTAFMKPKVPDDIRRLALHKLWSDPVFNETDDLASYGENYAIQGPVMQAKASVVYHRGGTAR